MKKILVITDSSNELNNALIYTKQFANIFDSKIVTYNPYKLNGKTVEVFSEIILNEEAIFNKIVLIQKNENIDLIVIGTNNNDGLNESVLSNITESLVKTCSVPLLIIPANYKFNKIKSIAFAVDFILETEFNMQKTMNNFLSYIKPKVFVLNVVKQNTDIMDDRIVSENNIEKYFENEKHIYSFIENNNLINGLNDFIVCNNIDMISMLPHKHNFLENIFIESQTKKMVFNTTIPLIIFPLGD